MSSIPTITSEEAASKMKDGKLLLLDVREDNEFEFAKVVGAKHIPVIQVPARLDELDKDQEIGVMCLGGGRSGRITGYLIQQGFTNVKNIEGGIRRWSEQIDDSIPKYKKFEGQIIPL